MSRRHAKARRKTSRTSIGTLRLTQRGYGFVGTADGQYLITRGKLKGAMDGDVVEVCRLRHAEVQRRIQRDSATESFGTRYGAKGMALGGGSGTNDMIGGVLRVIERAHETVIGTYEHLDGLGVVRPFDERIPDIFIDSRILTGLRAQDGDAVLVRITTYPSRLEAAAGYIEEIIGSPEQGGLNTELIIRKHEIETEFSSAAIDELKSLSQQKHFEKALKDPQRKDLRNRFIFTVDPKDAKDFDDAISVDYVDGQLRLGVHIADVSAFVAWESALDLNARRRATSTYLPDRVIPMLPHLLSDELCSLRPNEDRLALSVDMFMNADGSVAKVEFFSSVICSDVRLTYEQAQMILEGRDDENKGISYTTISELKNKLHALNKLTKKLASRRLQRGAIEFESREVKVELDEKSRPINVYIREKTQATALIEEAMILANEQVAAYALAANVPFIYRVHEEPLPLSLEELLPTLREFGYLDDSLGAAAPLSSKQIQAILKKSSSKPEHYLISSLLLRAMKRAQYSEVFTTHYGLASGAYTHFTSPIRRYPDLVVHRLLKDLLCGRSVSEGLKKQLSGICKHASERERASDLASYEATSLKLCEYLEPHCGELFWGIIVVVSSYGLVVREDTTTAEGFIRAEDICMQTQGEEFVYEPKRHRYVDANSGKCFRLGQSIRVKLVAVDYKNLRLKFVVA